MVFLCLLWVVLVLLVWWLDEIVEIVYLFCLFKLVCLFFGMLCFDVDMFLCGVCLCGVMIDLGLIFVKVGQVFFICCDLIFVDIVDEFVLLQDQVLLFFGVEVCVIVECELKQLVIMLFVCFDEIVLVFVLIVQVYVVMLCDGCEVVVKVLCLGIGKCIVNDVVLLCLLGELVNCWYLNVDKICLLEVVVEVEKMFENEFDLQCEGVSVSLFWCNFVSGVDMYVFVVEWDYIIEGVFMFECVYGVSCDDVVVIDVVGIDCKVFVVKGVWVFYEQVFCDNFFYVDVYFGNVWVDFVCKDDLCFIVLDFGIMGLLLEVDQYWLVQNFIVLFECDYQCIVQLYIDVGWMLLYLCVDELVVVVCMVCELYFICLLLQILLVELVVKLFCIVQKFEFMLQLQLILLQKILFNIEGVGCMFDLDIDIWVVVYLVFECILCECYSLCCMLKEMCKWLFEWIYVVLQLFELVCDVFKQVVCGEMCNVSDLLVLLQQVELVCCQQCLLGGVLFGGSLLIVVVLLWMLVLQQGVWLLLVVGVVGLFVFVIFWFCCN